MKKITQAVRTVEGRALRTVQKSEREKTNRRKEQMAKIASLMEEFKQKQNGGILERNFQEDQLSDPFQMLYTKHNLLVPVYSFDRLYQLYEESDILRSCVGAMQNNVDGFGWKLMFLGDDTIKDAKEEPEAIRQRELIENLLGQINESQSLTTIRKRLREDMEVIGNGAFEILRNLKGEITMMYYAPFRKIRISAYKGTAVTVPVKVMRGGSLVTVNVKKYFRRFVQLDMNGKSLRWFKEFGDPREMNYKNGNYEKSKYKATELWHFKIPFGGMTYGLPRWIGAVLQVMGRRSGQYVNYDLFENQGIPPMAVLVSGGVLTDTSFDELENLWVRAQGIEQFNRVLLLESELESTGLDEKGSAKIELKNLSEYRKEDLMFDRYLSSAKDDIRHTFRIPDLLAGLSEAYTHATAKAAQTMAEEQIFNPERSAFDEQINLRLLNGEFGITLWKYQTKGPRIAGASDTSKIVQTFSNAGAFTINHAIEQANEAFGLEMSKFKESWANYPIPIVIELVKTGQLGGLEEILNNATEGITKTVGNPVVPVPTEKMLKNDLFTDDEKALYKLLMTLQTVINDGRFDCHDESDKETCSD